MIVLHLGCRNYGIGLELPTTYDEAAKRISALREGLGQPAPVQITAVSGPIPNLYSYIQHAGLESESDIRKLNALAEKIDHMTQPEQQIFSGALELEAVGGLDNALAIADSLAQYEMLPQITTDEELGRFLVDTAPEFSFPKEVQPYLDYAKIGLEQRNVLAGAHTQYGYIRRRERAISLEEAEKSIIRVTLSTPDESVCLGLPCSEEQLAQAKRVLGVMDFTEAHLSKLEYATPSLESLVPLDDFTVEDANELTQYLHQMGKSNELWKFCAVLEVEEPDSFSVVLNLAEDLSRRSRNWGRPWAENEPVMRMPA